MSIDKYRHYKTFLKSHIETFPRAGRGELRRLAEALNVQPTIVTMIVNGDRHFTPDQAALVCNHYGFDERTAEYFLNLVCLARAETKELKTMYRKKRDRLRAEFQNIKNLMSGKEELSPELKAHFYSNWYYSGVSLYCSIGGSQTIDSIANHFGLSRAKVAEIVSFLLDAGLCTEKDSRIYMSEKHTHINRQSPYVNNHRRNWRDKAKERFNEVREDEIFFSSPASLSKKDEEVIREKILQLIKEFADQVQDSPEETLRCLNIDWFEF